MRSAPVSLRPKRCSRLALVGAACSLACNGGSSDRRAPDGGAEPAIETAGPTIQLELQTVADDSAIVWVGYNRRQEQIGPRVVELFLDATDNLLFVAAKPLDGATVAGKDLVVQQVEGGLRLMLYSTTSLLPLESGFFAQLSLARSNTATASLAMRNVGQAFAPAEANDGFVPPEPLVIGGI